MLNTKEQALIQKLVRKEWNRAYSLWVMGGKQCNSWKEEADLAEGVLRKLTS